MQFYYVPVCASLRGWLVLIVCVCVPVSCSRFLHFKSKPHLWVNAYLLVVHLLVHALSVYVDVRCTTLRPRLLPAPCVLSRLRGDRTWHGFAIFPPPTNRLALRTFPSDWTKFLWKATRACGWHKVISRFAVTLKWYAICRTVNSPLPVTDRNWPGWGPHKMGFPVDVSRRAPKQVTWRGIKISRSSDCFKQ